MKRKTTVPATNVRSELHLACNGIDGEGSKGASSSGCRSAGGWEDAIMAERRKRSERGRPQPRADSSAP